jgi:hypothetical protein
VVLESRSGMVMVTEMTTLVMAVPMLVPVDMTVDTVVGTGTVVDTEDMGVVLVVTLAVDLEGVVVVTLAVDLEEEVVVTMTLEEVGTKMKMAVYTFVKL